MADTPVRRKVQGTGNAVAAGNLGRHRVRMHTYFEPPANTHWTFGSDALAK